MSFVVRASFCFLLILQLGDVSFAASKKAASPNHTLAKSIFNRQCAVCHGQDGAGTTEGKALKVVDLRSDETRKSTNVVLASAIANGRNNMPGFDGSLSASEIKSLVAYVRTLGPVKRAN